MKPIKLLVLSCIITFTTTTTYAQTYQTKKECKTERNTIVAKCNALAKKDSGKVGQCKNIYMALKKMCDWLD